MITRRDFTIFVVAGFACLAGPLAGAAEPSARDFVAATYKHYQGKNAKGIPIDSALAKTLLTPGLVAVIDADAKRAARRKEVPTLDGDPFVDAQDFDDIGPVAIDVVEKEATATAKVGFSVFGEKKLVTLSLKKANGTWRIDDFVDPFPLRKALSRKK